MRRHRPSKVDFHPRLILGYGGRGGPTGFEITVHQGGRLRRIRARFHGAAKLGGVGGSIDRATDGERRDPGGGEDNSAAIEAPAGPFGGGGKANRIRPYAADGGERQQEWQRQALKV